jgi:hypothetical protein
MWSQIDGCQFGRMDIMYKSTEDLANGKNFQIVEINGAISEPTHMYDPKHSLLFGWKELTRHFHYMYLISKNNHENGAKYLTFKEGVQEFKNHHKHYYITNKNNERYLQRTNFERNVFSGMYSSIG